MQNKGLVIFIALLFGFVSVFQLSFTFKSNQVENNAINLGLDLKGGINVILQISVKDILQNLSNNSKDLTFNQALVNAEQMQKNSQNTI